MCRTKRVVTLTLFKLILQGHYITNPNHAFLRANHSKYIPYICMGNLMTRILPEPASTDPRSALPFFFLPRSRLWVQPATRRPRLSAFECVPKSGYIKKGSKASQHIKSTPLIYSEVGSKVGIHPKEMKLSLKHCNSFDLGCPSGCHIGTPSILGSGRRVETSALDQLWWCWLLGVGYLSRYHCNSSPLWPYHNNCPKWRPETRYETRID